MAPQHSQGGINGWTGAIDKQNIYFSLKNLLPRAHIVEIDHLAHKATLNLSDPSKYINDTLHVN